MPCYHPINCYQSQPGAPLTFGGGIEKNAGKYPMQISCGQCVGCRQKRARDWAIRCMHESQLYSQNCFITLTYNDENLPEDKSLHYGEFQEFMKRLRFSHKGFDRVKNPNFGKINKKTNLAEPEFIHPIRFYMCGEYGTNFGRPHFHALLFNFDFDDKVFLKKAPSSEMLYRSKKLESLWEFGFSSIGAVTFQSAAYVARYINQKITGDLADDHYTWINPETGEVFFRTPEFNKMSLKPGIGKAWLEKYKSDVFPHDYVVSKGAKLPVPRYYNKVFQCSNPYEWDEVSYERYLKSRNLLDDNTPERLAVKKQVHLAKISLLKRTLS